MKNKINNKMTEKTHVISYVIDLLDIPPFMCSPFLEGWIWGENLHELLNYLFEELIGPYLSNSLLLSSDVDLEKLDELSFLETTKIYINLVPNSKNDINSLIEEYMNINNKITYIDFLNILIRLETLVKKFNIDLKIESYYSPLEARNSKMLKSNKFNYENLLDNFD